MKKLFVALLVIVLIAGGLYGAASIILGNGKGVDISFKDSDYTAALTKSKVNIANIEDINLMNIGNKAYTTKGTVKIEDSFTNAEMSALIDKANQNGGPIKNFRVKFLGNNQGEISFKLTSTAVDFIKNNNLIKNTAVIVSFIAPPQYSFAAITVTDFVVKYLSGIVNNKPIYAKGKLERTSANSLSLNIESISVGQVTLSADIVKRVQSATEDFVNTIISKENGFSIDELRIEDGKLYYKGTLPAEVQGTKIK